MFKKILLLLVVLIAGFAAYVALQPAEYSVERSATMTAPAADVFAQVNDFHNWEAWSPWAKLDPKAANSFEGPAAGAGAIFKWSGDNKVGEGMMTILESKPNELIKIKLDFKKPMEGTSVTTFTFKEEGKQTQVNWKMSGENNFVGKAMCVFNNMDKMLGGYFEQGLANLKGVVEKAK